MRKVLTLTLVVLLTFTALALCPERAHATYYYNFVTGIAPAFPNMNDDVEVTISLETACINYLVSFSSLSQIENSFFVTVDVYVPGIVLPAIGYEEETYLLGKLAAGSYPFHVTVRVWDGYYQFFLLESQLYTESFTVESWSAIVPDDYLTIQEAVNHAADGDSIFVRNGIYYENVVVNKSVSIVGEDSGTTFVNGGGTGDAFQVTADEVTIRGFHLLSATNGVHLLGSNYSYVYDNIIDDIQVAGIALESSCNNTVEANRVGGFPSIGIAVVWNSENNSIKGNRFENSHDYGVNVVANNNVIVGNTIANNAAGLYVMGVGNTLYHNNVIDNEAQAIGGGFNAWDNGFEGNYWSDYGDRYPNASYDIWGIGDTPYTIDENNQDNYPLMNVFWNPSDTDHDLDVDLFDIVKVCHFYGAEWQHECGHIDLAEPYGTINIFDIVTIATNYGKVYSYWSQ